MKDLIIRQEEEKDFSKIYEVNKLAFQGEEESVLIEKLRLCEEYIPGLSLVAEWEEEIVGHILLTPIQIKNPDESYHSLALAPMSVLPGYQRKGIGSRLIEQGLKSAKQLGFTSIIVLGHANYYPKFGFRSARSFEIECPFEVPDSSWMALELKEGVLESLKGMVQYLPPFTGE